MTIHTVALIAGQRIELYDADSGDRCVFVVVDTPNGLSLHVNPADTQEITVYSSDGNCIQTVNQQF